MRHLQASFWYGEFIPFLSLFWALSTLLICVLVIFNPSNTPTRICVTWRVEDGYRVSNWNWSPKKVWWYIVAWIKDCAMSATVPRCLQWLYPLDTSGHYVTRCVREGLVWPGTPGWIPRSCRSECTIPKKKNKKGKNRSKTTRIDTKLVNKQSLEVARVDIEQSLIHLMICIFINVC